MSSSSGPSSLLLLTSDCGHCHPRLHPLRRRPHGLPVTIGVGGTRTLAKLFSDTAKPFGAVAVLNRDHERDVLSRLSVTEIAGIAGRRAARLAPYGIRSCLDLADVDGKLVKKLLTKTGHELWMELNGVPVTPVRPDGPPHKVIARGGTLMGNVDDPARLWAWTVRPSSGWSKKPPLPQRPHHAARRPGLLEGRREPPAGRAVVRRGHRQVRRTARRARWRCGGRTVDGATATHLHVLATELRRGKGVQLSLFDCPDPRRAALAAVKSAVNDKFGRFKLRSGNTAPAGEPCTRTRRITSTCATSAVSSASDFGEWRRRRPVHGNRPGVQRTPTPLVEQAGLDTGFTTAAAGMRFHYDAMPSQLPVWWNGRLHVVRWGNRDRVERKADDGVDVEGVGRGREVGDPLPEPVLIPAAGITTGSGARADHFPSSTVACHVHAGRRQLPLGPVPVAPADDLEPPVPPHRQQRRARAASRTAPPARRRGRGRGPPAPLDERDRQLAPGQGDGEHMRYTSLRGSEADLAADVADVEVVGRVRVDRRQVAASSRSAP